MSTEKMREEFEAWICGIWPGVSISRNSDDAAMFAGSYRDERVHMAWKGWQSSRAAIEVELPDSSEFDSPADCHQAIRDCRYAIESLGLKVKP